MQSGQFTSQARRPEDPNRLCDNPRTATAGRRTGRWGDEPLRRDGPSSSVEQLSPTKRRNVK